MARPTGGARVAAALVAAALLLAAALPGGAAQDLAGDRAALLALRGALDRGGVLPWDPAAATPCGWRGVACAQSQAGPRVVELQLPGSAAKDLAEDRAALLALRGALDRGGVLPWVHEELRGGKAPQQQERRLPLLSFGEAIEDRRGTGFPALNRGSGGGGTGGGVGTRAWGRCKYFFFQMGP